MNIIPGRDGQIERSIKVLQILAITDYPLIPCIYSIQDWKGCLKVVWWSADHITEENKNILAAIWNVFGESELDHTA